LRSLWEAVLTDAMWITKFWCKTLKIDLEYANLEQEFIERLEIAS
jgi:hypothetical protein